MVGAVGNIVRVLQSAIKTREPKYRSCSGCGSTKVKTRDQIGFWCGEFKCNTISDNGNDRVRRIARGETENENYKQPVKYC